MHGIDLNSFFVIRNLFLTICFLQNEDCFIFHGVMLCLWQIVPKIHVFHSVLARYRVMARPRYAWNRPQLIFCHPQPISDHLLFTEWRLLHFLQSYARFSIGRCAICPTFYGYDGSFQQKIWPPGAFLLFLVWSAKMDFFMLKYS